LPANKISEHFPLDQVEAFLTCTQLGQLLRISASRQHAAHLPISFTEFERDDMKRRIKATGFCLRFLARNRMTVEHWEL
jgi:hypothetical protein